MAAGTKREKARKLFVFLNGWLGNAFAKQVSYAMHSLVSRNPYDLDISNDGFPEVQWASGARMLASMSISDDT